MYFNNKNINLSFPKLNVNKIIIIGVFIVLLIIMLALFINRKRTVYIDLIGDEEITMYQGSDYVEPGYKAYNSRNEDLNEEVIIKSDLDIDKIGEYEIIYRIDDVVKTRKVKVIEKDKEYTYIYLNAIDNNVNIYLSVGDDYVEPGYQVFNSYGLDLLDEVEIEGFVDTSKSGNYVLTYSLYDSSNVKISVTRTVVVMDSEVNLSIVNKDYTNGNVKIEISVIDNFFDYIELPNGNKIEENKYIYEVSENGTYTFKTYNIKGISEESNIKVSNIDRSIPSGSCNGSYADGKSTINIIANDNIGINKYEINGISYASKNITINEELEKVNIKIYDKAGNIKDISCSLEDKNIFGNLDNINPGYPSIKNTENISVNFYNDFAYWVYLPDKVTKNLPILFFLPGNGEVGNDYKDGTEKAILWGPINEIRDHGHSYNAIIINIQYPSGKKVYGYVDIYIELINKIADEFKADKNRISFLGFSHGCYGMMSFIKKYPKYFSALVPVGCDPDNTNAQDFINQPVWAFVGGSDGSANFPSFVSKINNLGGNAKYSVSKSKIHNVMNDSYSILRDEEFDLINWMISQKKG